MNNRQSRPRLRIVMMMEPGIMRDSMMRVLECSEDVAPTLTVVETLLALRREVGLRKPDVMLTGLAGQRETLRDFFLFYSHYLRFDGKTTWLLDAECLTPLLTTWNKRASGEGPLCLHKRLTPDLLHCLLRERRMRGHQAFMANDLSYLQQQEGALSWEEIQVIGHFAYGALAQLCRPGRGFTPKTVSYYKRNAMRKLGVSSNQALLALLSKGSASRQRQTSI